MSSYEKDSSDYLVKSTNSFADAVVKKMKPSYSQKYTIIGVTIICTLIAVTFGVTISFLESIDARTLSNQEQINNLSKEIHNSENRIIDRLHMLDKQSLEIKNDLMMQIKELKKDG